MTLHDQPSATLVTGASGMLGTAIAQALQARGEPLCLAAHSNGVRIHGAATWTGDLSVPGAAGRLVRELRPRCVVHCAAYTDVDWCESHAESAAALHVGSTEELAAAAAEIGAAFVLISTDAVFDGEQGNYDEHSTPAPLNVYATTKLLGEIAATKAHPRPLIVRTCIYGWNPATKRGLAEWLFGRLLSMEPAGCFVDVLFTPILANDCADILLKMLDRNLAGIYHVGGPAAVSKFDFARHFARAFEFDESRIVPARVADHHFVARRPRNSSLVSTKAEQALELVFPDLESGLARFRTLRDFNGPRNEPSNGPSPSSRTVATTERSCP